MRSLPPVHSPISLRDLVRGGFAASGLVCSGDGAALQEQLRRVYGADTVLLCDSGTSALVAAFKAVARDGPITIACPAYICVDAGAAAAAAGVRLALYDTDPRTLSPDMDSLERVVAAGCGAVVVAHLFGYPIDIDAVQSLCQRRGVVLIEDAAQESGGTVHGRRLGSFGDLTILSFGRGKGVTGGGGGALLVRGGSPSVAEFFAQRVGESAGWRQLVMTSAQWALGRPSLYFLPLMIPGLQLGEMVFHEAHVPRAISRASVSLVLGSIAAQAEAVAARRANAIQIQRIAESVDDVETIRVLDTSEPSFLRFPVIAHEKMWSASHRVGAVRGYPRLLDEEPQLRGAATRGKEGLSGAIELRDRLFTLPTHSMLHPRDFHAIREWLSARE